MKTLGNVLWFLFGGALSCLWWYVVGVLMAVTIIGLPWSRACFTLGSFSCWPFGRRLVDRKSLTGRDDIGTGALGLIGNVIWLVCAGWHLALVHLTLAAGLAVTVIGIPFALQHFKLAIASLAPIGMTVVKSD